jgi:hypothetical protein
MVDVLTAVVAGAVGLGLGGMVSYFVFYSRAKPVKVVAAARAEPGTRAIATTFDKTDLDRSRREMRTIMVERDLLSSAMMKLYEAETEGRITREEREMISKRYSDQIKDLQSKLKDVELVVEVKKEAAPRVDREVELEKVVEKRARPEMTEAERRRKEIMNDVMGELARLEQIDIEKKQQEN